MASNLSPVNEMADSITSSKPSEVGSNVGKKDGRVVAGALPIVSSGSYRATLFQ